MASSNTKKTEFGDWQTPSRLAVALVEHLAREGIAPAALIEPTCGVGAFLAAGRQVFPKAQRLGFDINPDYVEQARNGAGCRIEVADFFEQSWEGILAELPRPLLVLGNPPWVTNSALGSLGSKNLPAKANFKNLSGFDAITGKSNFDISEWMIVRLVAALQPGDSLAMLCKRAVARRIIEHAALNSWPISGSLVEIDAKRFFNAAVDAAFFIVRVEEPSRPTPPYHVWPVFADVNATDSNCLIGFMDGQLCSDIEGFKRTRHLAGNCTPEWRSGMKHDCSAVMELTADLLNGLGEKVNIEDDFAFPLVKGSDLANGRVTTFRRRVLVTQRKIGEDTEPIRQSAPRTWEYLSRHRELLDSRKSSIYRGKPPFAIFGIGDYSFAPFKVAICGLYKRLEFALVGPIDGRPVMLDDTCYFLPFERLDDAKRAHAALRSETAKAFFESRIFWDAKRPISKAVLQSLDLSALISGSSKQLSLPLNKRKSKGKNIDDHGNHGH